MTVEDEDVQVERWTYRPDDGATQTAAEVRAFAAAAGMEPGPQQCLERAVIETLSGAVHGDRAEPITLAYVDAARDADWMAVRIEHNGFAPTDPMLVRLAELVDRVDCCASSAQASSVIQLECQMRPARRR